MSSFHSLCEIMVFHFSLNILCALHVNMRMQTEK